MSIVTSIGNSNRNASIRIKKHLFDSYSCLNMKNQALGNQRSHAQSRFLKVMAEKRKNYDLKFKLSAIRCAEETSNREAGRKFSVDESMIRR